MGGGGIAVHTAIFTGFAGSGVGVGAGRRAVSCISCTMGQPMGIHGVIMRALSVKENVPCTRKIMFIVFIRERILRQECAAR